jgi:tRNA 2-thiouridine synthesizing protein A
MLAYVNNASLSFFWGIWQPTKIIILFNKLTKPPCLASILLSFLLSGWKVEDSHISRRLIMASADLATLKAAAVVDARGSACPGPLMEAKKAIGKVKVGEVLEVLSNDPGTKDDMPLWAKKVGHEFLGSLGADGYDRIFIVRKK